MSTYELWVPGKVVPKGRPRLGRRGRVFTPQATTDYENHVRQAWWDQELPLLEGPLALHTDLYADGVQVVVTELGPERKSTLRYDADNAMKSIADGLQGAAYMNDKHVLEMWAAKW